MEKCVGRLNRWLLPWYFYVNSCWRYWSRSLEIDKLLTISLGLGFLVEERSFDVGRVACAASTIWEILSFLSFNFFSISFRERFSLERHLPRTCEPLLIIFWIGLFGSWDWKACYRLLPVFVFNPFKLNLWLWTSFINSGSSWFLRSSCSAIIWCS